MKDRAQSQLASILIVGVGVWLLVSPFFIPASTATIINTTIVGLVMALSAVAQLVWTNTFPSWTSIVAAVWLAFSVFILNASAASSWSMALSALTVCILALWDRAELKHFQHSPHYGSSH